MLGSHARRVSNRLPAPPFPSEKSHNALKSVIEVSRQLATCRERQFGRRPVSQLEQFCLNRSFDILGRDWLGLWRCGRFLVARLSGGVHRSPDPLNLTIRLSGIVLQASRLSATAGRALGLYSGGSGPVQTSGASPCRAIHVRGTVQHVTAFTDLLRSFGQAEHANRAVAELEQAHKSGPHEGLGLALQEARAAHQLAAEECQRMIDSLDA
jgi:hypothetical protein